MTDSEGNKVTTHKRTRLTGDDSTMLIQTCDGKSPGTFETWATVRTPGEPTQSGKRTTHATVDEAVAAHDELVSGATGIGWLVTKRARPSGFDVLPAPTKSDPERVKIANAKSKERAEKMAKTKAANKAKKAKGNGAKTTRK